MGPTKMPTASTAQPTTSTAQPTTSTAQPTPSTAQPTTSTTVATTTAEVCNYTNDQQQIECLKRRVDAMAAEIATLQQGCQTTCNSATQQITCVVNPASSTCA